MAKDGKLVMDEKLIAQGEHALRLQRILRDGIAFDRRVELASAHGKRTGREDEVLRAEIKEIEKNVRAERAEAFQQVRSEARRGPIRILGERARQPLREQLLHARPALQLPAWPFPPARVLELTAAGGDTSGFLTRSGAQPWEPIVDGGVWGWAGETLDLGFMKVDLPAMTHSNVAGGSRTATAALGWSTVKIPTTGTYKFACHGTLLVQGATTVHGEGWYLSGYDATVEVNLEVWVVLDNTPIVLDINLMKRDATKSEERTKRFTSFVQLPGDIYVDADAGQNLHFFARVNCSTWANKEGAAEFDLHAFGLISNGMEDTSFFLSD